MEQYNQENETINRETSFDEAGIEQETKEGFKPSAGFLVLCAGCLWALYELIAAIVYFF